MKHRATRAALVGLALGCSLTEAKAAPPRSESSASGRFEDTSPAVAWTGAWSKNALPANSAGGARLTMEAGAEASFTFNGGPVTWIGYRDEWCGLAEVLLDGALRATVDTYATPATAQATLYTIDGLGAGRHTLTIRAKGTHAARSAGAWVWVDAFVVGDPPADEAPSRSDLRRSRTPDRSDERRPGASPDRNRTRATTGAPSLRVEQDDAAVVYGGTWSTNGLAVHSGHSARLSMEDRSRLDFAFTGTGVSWIGYQDEWSGIAVVSLDGLIRAHVDTYSQRARAQVELYAIDGLPYGPHTLTIQPTGRRRPASGGAWIWVDALSIVH